MAFAAGPPHAACLNNLAKLLWGTGRQAEAEPVSRRAVLIFEASMGADSPPAAAARSVLARVLTATNRCSDAIFEVTQTITILATYRRQTGHEHPLFEAVVTNFRETLSAMELPAAEIERRLVEASGLGDSPAE